MGNTINSLNSFKKFSTVNTNVLVNEENNKNKASSTDTQNVAQDYNLNSDSNNKFSKINPAPSSDTAQTQTKVTYVKTPTSAECQQKLKSKILDDDFITKFNVEVKKTAKLPEYAYRGLKGDPDANFYEYLSLGKIPYFLGGPMLAAVFAFGMTRKNTQANSSASIKTKKIAVGVALYYIGVELAKKVIDIPVKLFRGVDLNHPFKNVVECRAVSKDGTSPQKVEYHKVPESADFTRWDLMTGDESINNGKNVTEKFDKLTAKFGIDKNVQNSDATLKGSIKKLIISSTAWKYMLAFPFVMLGVALAAQDAWGNLGNGIGENIKNLFNSKATIKQKQSKAKEIIKGNLITPMKESFKSLWGTDNWKNNKFGKAIILVSAIAPILANIKILQLTSEKDKRFVDISEYIPRFKKHTTS